MKDLVLPKEQIKQMTESQRSKAGKRLILSHLITVFILALINEARKGGKTRFDCVISTEKLIELFRNYFPLLKIEKAIREDLHQLDKMHDIIVLERFNFPQEDYIPTERVFNLMVKIFEELTEGDIIFLEDKLVSIFYVKVVNEATHELLATEDVKIGDTIPSLRTYFRIRKGEVEWFIPKKSAIKEKKLVEMLKISKEVKSKNE